MKTLDLRIHKYYARNGRPTGEFMEFCPGLSVAETADRLSSEGVETRPLLLDQLVGHHQFVTSHTANCFTQIQVSALS